MARARKMRIATSQSVGTAALVRSEVTAALGTTPATVLQEIDRSQLVLELSWPEVANLPDNGSDMARALEQGLSSSEILSAWDEEVDDEPPPARRLDAILHVPEAALVPAAFRALLDGVATSMWQQAERRWDLGVPATSHGTRAVGYLRRQGYTRRFSAHDVATAREGLRRSA